MQIINADRESNKRRRTETRNKMVVEPFYDLKHFLGIIKFTSIRE